MLDEAAIAQIDALVRKVESLCIYRPNFVMHAAPKFYEEPEPQFNRFYCAGLGCGVSILCLSAWVSLSLHLVNPL